MRKKILIAITTYKRPEKLLQILKDIKTQSVGFDIDIMVFEDYSNTDYSNTISYVKANFKKILWVKGEQYFGKSRYWMLIDKLFKLIKNRDFDYAIQIPDDIRLVDEFFSKAIDLYESINSHNIACLNILQDKRTSLPMWTPVEQEDIGAVLKTGWVDMCYIARKNFFEALEYTIYRVALSWAGDPNKSSGVGKQISERLYKHLNFFHVKDSLVTHGAHESVMHPLHRKTVPLVANNRKDKVIAGMASIPERTGSLKKVVDSIINQVDELHIYLNNYEEIPHFLNRDKVTAYLSNYEKGDLGDIGKFYNVEKATGYFLSIDDDLIYPPDYVFRMIEKIEQHNRKYVVSLHGRIFHNLPTTSYYCGHTKSYSCLSHVPEDAFAQIVGTGVLAFHTSTVSIKLKDFQATNMADIWFSKKCHEQNINLLIMAHKNRWVKEANDHDVNYSIYHFCNKNERLQTKIVNESRWNPVPETVL